jgi:uncharacterized protein GlcG (DUF336 family)
MKPGLAALASLLLAGCGGGSGGGVGDTSGAVGPATPAGCDGSCVSPASRLGTAEVGAVIARAVAEAQARGAAATIAVVDRSGNVLGVFRMNGAASAVRVGTGSAAGVSVSGGLEGVDIVPDTLAAIAKAVTGAYLSSEGNAFSTRSASQIVQDHFNPGERFAPGGPLFGVQFSQLPCGDLVLRWAGGAPGAGPRRSPLGLAADPGGFPLYLGGTPVGGVGVIADGVYALDPVTTDRDHDLDELVALAASFGLAAPADRRADRITVEGKTLRFSDARFDELRADPAAAPAFAAIDGSAGDLVAVPGYADAQLRAGLAFATPASGIRADALDFPGQDAFVLVDDADLERFRPAAGSDGPDALTATEVQAILSAALDVAARARAQIRRPLGSSARVTISLVDSNGAILGIVRSRDAPVFGIDVSLQKARSAAFLSAPAAAAALSAVPDAVYLDGGLNVLRNAPVAPYVGAYRAFLGLPAGLADGGVALSARAIGNLARPYYPDGFDDRDHGPFSLPRGEWSPFSTGLQLDLVYNGLIQHVGFVLGAAPDPGANCTGITGFNAGFASSAPIPALANGLQIFPGGLPIYRGEVLVGGIGVSGDGIDQDDMIAFLGLDAAAASLGSGLGNATAMIRADTYAPFGARLRYVNCPQSPFNDSTEQAACNGR